MRHRVEADLRRHAVDRAAPWALGRMAARHGGAALTYLNTGHANLARATLGGLSAAGVRVAVLIHDLIPVLTPDLVPADQPPAFAAKIETVRQHADLIIANSPDTETELARHWAGAERRPPVLLAPIGVSLPPPPAAPPAREAGRCVMLGTLEPRKNHAVILAAWSRLAADLPPEAMPQLHILGAPGFRGDTVRAAIRAHPLFGRAIHLHGPQGDAVIGDHLARADLLLYPSLAEGFGLPPWEALSAGVLPICADLPVLRDLLGTRAVHLPPEDAYSWAETIKQRLAGTLPGPETPLAGVPLWQDHFERVAAALGPRATRAEGHE